MTNLTRYRTNKNSDEPGGIAVFVGGAVRSEASIKIAMSAGRHRKIFRYEIPAGNIAVYVGMIRTGP